MTEEEEGEVWTQTHRRARHARTREKTPPSPSPCVCPPGSCRHAQQRPLSGSAGGRRSWSSSVLPGTQERPDQPSPVTPRPGGRPGGIPVGAPRTPACTRTLAASLSLSRQHPGRGRWDEAGEGGWPWGPHPPGLIAPTARSGRPAGEQGVGHRAVRKASAGRWSHVEPRGCVRSPSAQLHRVAAKVEAGHRRTGRRAGARAQPQPRTPGAGWGLT